MSQTEVSLIDFTLSLSLFPLPNHNEILERKTMYCKLLMKHKE